MQKTLIVWDIDGVKYDYHKLPDRGFYKLCDEANARAAQELLPGLARDEASRLSAESFKKFHDCYGAFMPLAEKSGLAPEEFRRRLFKRYHAILFELLEERHAGFMDGDAETVAAFCRYAPFFSHAALSHSCMEGWATKILDKMGLLPFFEASGLWGLDDYDFVRKFESHEPLANLIRHLGFAPERTVFVEDSLDNLETAKKGLPALTAVYVHHGKELSELPPYIDYQCRDPAEAITMLADRTA